MSTGLVSLDDIRHAASLLNGIIVRTPLVPAAWAGDLLLKPEGLQPTGAFKLRGASNAVSMLDPSSRARGVITHSSGNHGRALAWVARMHRIPATIVMPDAAAPVKVEATRALGAEIIMVPPAERDSTAEALRAERDLAFIPPFDHADVIAGGGTVGLEIIEERPTNIDTVLVPVGGGGLISGIAAAVKRLAPEMRVVGVEPELAADLAESLARGERMAWDPTRTNQTVADGVRLPTVGELPWRHIQTFVDDVVTVTEDAILEAMALIASRSGIVAEPSGALTTAAFLSAPSQFGATVAVVSGGNADPALLAQALGRFAGRA